MANQIEQMGLTIENHQKAGQSKYTLEDMHCVINIGPLPVIKGVGILKLVFGITSYFVLDNFAIDLAIDFNSISCSDVKLLMILIHIHR